MLGHLQDAETVVENAMVEKGHTKSLTDVHL